MASAVEGMIDKVTSTVNGLNSTNSTTIIPILIDNKAHPSTDSFPVHAPATGALLYHCASATVADVDAALASSQRAFPAWRDLPLGEKRDIFLNAAKLLGERREALGRSMVDETGAAAAWADFNLDLSVQIFLDIAGRVGAITRGTVASPSDPTISALILQEPYGVVLAIAPWNAPFILAIRALVYPLAAGNTVILKATELSPACSAGIVSILHDAGLPAGVLNMVMHKPEHAATITSHLINHPYIKKINFTGSTAVGRIIAEQAGRALKPVLLELGGKAPAVVLDDADLELAAGECSAGSFLHSGQICMSTERIIVHRSVADKFEEELKKAIAGFSPETDPAPLVISKAAVDRNHRHVNDAVAKGATIIYGKLDRGEGTTAMRPLVVKGITKDMDIYKQESFGPTVSLIIVDSEEEALELANDTEYGLSSAVFTRDLSRALRFAKGIESGAVHINRMTVHDETALPHGGVKSSGYGRFGSIGLEEWVRSKTVTFRN